MKRIFLALLSVLIVGLSALTILLFNRLNEKTEQTRANEPAIVKINTIKATNYTVGKCLNRFKSDQEFLALIQSGPNVTDETKVLASKTGALMTGNKIWDSEMGWIDPDTDSKSATVKEIKEALEARGR